MDSPTVRLAPEQIAELAEAIAKRIVELQARPTLHPSPLTCADFAASVRRSVEYVQDLCRLRMIRTLPGKPYRILPEELARYLMEGPRFGRGAK